MEREKDNADERGERGREITGMGARNDSDGRDGRIIRMGRELRWEREMTWMVEGEGLGGSGRDGRRDGGSESERASERGERGREAGRGPVFGQFLASLTSFCPVFGRCLAGVWPVFGRCLTGV